MKNKTGIYTLRTAVILLLMITLALTAFCVPAFAAALSLIDPKDRPNDENERKRAEFCASVKKAGR